jgi:bla regulator protein blaR1
VESWVETWIVARLLTGTLHGACVIAVVWLVCRRFPAIPAPVQAGLWWLASLKLLLVFAPIPTIALPLLPATPLLVLEPSLAAGSVPDGVPAAAAGEPLRWLSIVVALWMSGLGVQTIRLWRACRRVRSLVAGATPLTASEVAIAPAMARVVGLRRCPDVRLSEAIAAPLLTGIRRPVVLLPAALPDNDRSMALCHEFVHVRRHDLALGWIPALAERLFFFHPLVRFGAREYLTAREAACDAGVVRALGVSAGDYGRLLVRLGVAPAEPLPAAGGAPASVSSLRRRLDMLQHAPLPGRSRSLAWLLAAALALFLVPFDVTARPVPPTPPAAPAAPLPPIVPTPAAPPVAALPPAAPLPPVPLPPVPLPPAQAISPAAPTAPVAPVPPIAGDPRPQISPEHRDVLNSMRFFEREMRRQAEVDPGAYRRSIQEYNALAEQANRLAREQEAEIRRRYAETTESFLRQQRDQLTRRNEDEFAKWAAYVRETQESLLKLFNQQQKEQRDLSELQKQLGEQQKQLNEVLRQLLRETERIGNAVSPRK